MICAGQTRSVAHQTAGRSKLAEFINRRQGMKGRQRDELLAPGIEERVSGDEECFGS